MKKVEFNLAHCAECHYGLSLASELASQGCHNNQHNNTQHNDTQHSYKNYNNSEKVWV